jgi:hypothetical protein
MKIRKKDKYTNTTEESRRARRARGRERLKTKGRRV